MTEHTSIIKKELSTSMKIFLDADPMIQDAIKKCLDEERLVMNMLNRPEIKKNLVQTIKNITKKD
jgi:hypothetical protein